MLSNRSHDTWMLYTDRSAVPLQFEHIPNENVTHEEKYSHGKITYQNQKHDFDKIKD